ACLRPPPLPEHRYAPCTARILGAHDDETKEDTMTRQQWTLLGGVGLGAGLMFLLDPDKGRRRRALVRDKAVHYGKVTGRKLRGTSKHLKNKGVGHAAEVKGQLRRLEEERDQPETVPALQGTM
ncbi:MAG: hypothetical protein ACREN5_03440, partial [Gemmatimonadales bacterium]